MLVKTQFELDWEKPLMINGNQSNKGYYNLIVTIRDLKMYKVGLKPHRAWRISDVKKYFGIKGSVDTLIAHLERWREEVLA